MLVLLVGCLRNYLKEIENTLKSWLKLLAKLASSFFKLKKSPYSFIKTMTLYENPC